MVNNHYSNRQVWAHLFIELLVRKFECKHGDLCVKSSCDAALHQCERFRGFKVDLSHCPDNICLTTTVHVGRCGHVCLLSFLLGNLNANVVICE